MLNAKGIRFLDFIYLGQRNQKVLKELQYLASAFAITRVFTKMHVDKVRSATVAVKIRKTKRETPKRPKTSWVKDVWSLHVGEVRSHVARFVEFLSNKDSWQLQVEAAWVLTSAFDGSTPSNDHLLEPIFQKLYSNQESLELAVVGILSDHTILQGIATKQFRTLLSINEKLDLCEAMKFSVILRFAQFIKMPYCLQQLKDDSAWILVLIFSFRLAYKFDRVEYGLVEVLAVLVVGEVKHGVLTPLLNKLKEANNNFPMQREATRTLSLIFKSRPDLPSKQVTSAVYSLLELLRSDDDEVLTNVCCALSYRIDGIRGIIQHHNN
ncbi:PREDICTED: importin subunit alpha-4-like [Nicotiana attenuata]|uniref:importin subunit alpha-4-like n=1 Tax=Nicotiana attenuata TaxID=49451 RepID=UPI000904A85A|nr:PREDICTED: importin subunit alpha-4-like [Nicotiana attenuata]